MKKLICKLLTLFIFSPLVSAFSCNEMPLSGYVDNDGKEHFIRVNQEKIKKTEPWSPASEDIPLSIQDAIKILEKTMSDKFPKYDRFVVDTITLESYKCPEIHGRWYYSLLVTPIMDGVKLYKSYQYVVVLFDGSIHLK